MNRLSARPQQSVRVPSVPPANTRCKAQPLPRLSVLASHWAHAAGTALSPLVPQVFPGTGGRPSSDSYSEGASASSLPGLSR